MGSDAFQSVSRRRMRAVHKLRRYVMLFTTNIRVYCIAGHSGRNNFVSNTRSQRWAASKRVRHGDAVDLFDHGCEARGLVCLVGLVASLFCQQRH